MSVGREGRVRGRGDQDKGQRPLLLHVRNAGGSSGTAEI